MMISFWRNLRPRSRILLLMSAGLLLIILLASFALWETGRADIFDSGQDDVDT